MKKSKYDVRRTVEIEHWGKITATAGTLNSLSIMLMESANKYRKEGNKETADLRDRQSDHIYSALARSGFYKDWKTNSYIDK